MNTTFSFVHELESLPKKLQICEETIVRILETTADCAALIEEYLHRGALGMYSLV